MIWGCFGDDLGMIVSLFLNSFDINSNDNLKKELEIALSQQTGKVNDALDLRIQKLRANLDLQNKLLKMQKH